MASLIISYLKEQLQTVAISEDWYIQGLSKIKEWEQDDKHNSNTINLALEIKLKEAEQKINKLVDSYLEGMIKKDTYLKKKEELIKQKNRPRPKEVDFTEWQILDRTPQTILERDFSSPKIVTIQRFSRNQIVCGQKRNEPLPR